MKEKYYRETKIIERIIAACNFTLNAFLEADLHLDLDNSSR